MLKICSYAESCFWKGPENMCNYAGLCPYKEQDTEDQFFPPEATEVDDSLSEHPSRRVMK